MSLPISSASALSSPIMYICMCCFHVVKILLLFDCVVDYEFIDCCDRDSFLCVTIVGIILFSSTYLDLTRCLHR